MELAIQKFIKINGLEAAVAKWNLKVTEQDGLAQLNYDMINSPNGIQEVDECRGLILDKKDWSVVSFPFYRFYNEGEGNAEKPDLSTSALLEKLDGSLISCYFHPILNKWVVATRGRILADGGVNSSPDKIFGSGETKTFSQLFWETMKNYPTADNMFKSHFALNGCYKFCCVFELFGPENRILTKYDKSDIRLLTIRNLETMEEIGEKSLENFSKITGILRPKKYEFKTKEDIFEIFKTFKPTEEGFVLTDYAHKKNGNYLRVKIKNPRYLALHHLIGAGEGELLTGKRVASLIRSGDASEVISYFPEFENKIREMEMRFKGLAGEIDSKFESIKNLGNNRKEFALEATKYKIPGAMFMLLDKKVANGYEFVMKMKEENLLELLK